VIGGNLLWSIFVLKERFSQSTQRFSQFCIAMAVTSNVFLRTTDVVKKEQVNQEALNTSTPRILSYCFSLLFILLTSATFGADRYWVGGSGDWNDISHWSATSNGVGGASLPQSEDNVFFDNTSFGTATTTSIQFASGISQCHNLQYTATGTSTIFHGSGSLEVFGDFELTADAQWSTTGLLHFRGRTANRNIHPNGAKINSNVRFNGKGSWQLQSMLNAMSYTITLEKGSLTTNNNTIACTQFNASGSGKRSLILGNSTMVILGGWNIADASNMILNAGGSKLLFGDDVTPIHVQLGNLTYNQIEYLSQASPQYKATNTCGNGAGEIPFTIDANLVSDYNGWGVTCKDTCDGIVAVEVIGGVGPFTFSWLPSNCTTDTCFNICAGNQIVIVTDIGQNIQCATTVNVPDPAPLTVLFTNYMQPSCNGTCDGAATAFAVGGEPGVGGYQYLWNNVEITATSSALCNGINTLNVTDANGCTYDTTFNITSPTVITPNVAVTDVSCFGFCNGFAISNPSGGNGAPYTFQWQAPLTSSTDSSGLLCPGMYTVSVMDVDGCTVDTTITITEPTPLIVTLENSVDLICNGVCTGELAVSASNGTGPYSYQWLDDTMAPLPTQTDSNATGMCAGDFFVEVTDALGCSIVSGPYTLTEPPAIVSTINGYDVNCNGVCDGAAAVTVTGGTPGYTFQWFDVANGMLLGQTMDTVSGLCPGDYFLQATDASGCLHNSDTVTITEPPVIVLAMSSTDVTCFGLCDGTATVAASGGTPGYTYAWFDANTNNPIGQTGIVATALCAGDYYVEVTDANGCLETSSTVTIIEPLALTITATATDVSCNGICDGTATVVITGGTPGYTIDWFDANTNISTGQTNNTATGLCAGDYFAQITDANGCVGQSPTVTVNEPAAITTTAVVSNVSCGGLCDGSITLTVMGGTSPYTFNWFDDATNTAIGQTGNPAINLCAGDYFAVVTDANGCTFTTPVETVTEPAPLSLTATATDASCFGECDGTATVTITGGTSPFTIDWIDNATATSIGQSTLTATNLCAGSYFATVTDANGCTDNSAVVTVNEPTQLIPTLTINDASCNGVCDGSGSMSASGGAGGYSVLWESLPGPVNIGTGVSVNALCAGNYQVTLTDASGCDTTMQFTVTEPPVLVVNNTFNDPSCNGFCDGDITAVITGGTSPYTIQWLNSSNVVIGSGVNIPNLCSGTYTLNVTDANGCTGSNSITLTDPLGLTITLDGTTPAACGGVCNGGIDITVTGGTSPYTFNWYVSLTNVFVSAAEDPTGLCSGDYTLEVTDASGCVDTLFNVQVTENPLVTATLTSNQPSCDGVCDGTASVVPGGGQIPYTFTWQNSTPTIIGNGTSVSGLCPDTYQVFVTDVNGCNSAPQVFVITNPTPITATTDTTTTSCFGLCDGTATVTPAGGTGAFVVQWDAAAANQTGTTATNLCAGVYNVSIIDGNGCQLDTFVEVTGPTGMTLVTTSTNLDCNGICNGSATIIISGSVSPYILQWIELGVGPVAGGTNTIINNLCAGSYFAQVTDALGCLQNSDTVTIIEPTLLSASIINANDALCFDECTGTAQAVATGGTAPYSYSWAPDGQNTDIVTNFCAGTHDVTITDANGCTATASITIGEPAPFNLTSSSTDVTCNGNCDGTATVTINSGGVAPFTFLWNDPFAQTTATAINLCAGFYDVTVSDANGCDTTITLQVSEPAAITINLISTNVTCTSACDGEIVSVVGGGTVALDYTYSWIMQPGNVNMGSTSSINSLCFGTYILTVTDDLGCTAMDTVVLTEPTPLQSSFTSTPAQCTVCDGTAVVTVLGGSPTYSFTWSPAPTGTGQGTNSATGLCAGVYNVAVVDSLGCSTTVPVIVNSTATETLAMDSVPTSCNGLCDGQAYVTIVGGCTFPTCTFEWFDGTGVPIGQTTDTASNLCAGDYFVQVTNGSGCVSIDSITVTEEPFLEANETITQPSCAGVCDGTITVVPTGGTGPYTFVWSTSANTTDTETGLCPGNVDLTISDINGCSLNFSFTLTDPAVLDVSNITSNDISCNGANDGVATVFPTGGTVAIDYTYNWINCGTGLPIGQTTQQATGLAAGQYQVVVTDDAGCTETTICVTIVEPAIITATFAVVDAMCNGFCDGQATITVSGGTPNFQFEWLDASMVVIPGANQATLTGLCAGNYFVNVTDVNGCTGGPFMVTVSEPSQINPTVVSQSNVSCNGLCDGEIIIGTTGGVGAITFQWFDVFNTQLPGTTNTQSALCPGDYYAVAFDAVGCFDSIPLTTITQAPVLLLTMNSTNLSCNAVCDGIADVQVTGGALPYTFQWYDGTSTLLPGETNDSLTNLCGGDFIVEVIDANGCSAIDTVTVIEPTPLGANMVANNTACGACNGSATVNPTGGTPGYTFFWSANAGNATTQNVTGLCPSIYLVEVTDASGCVDTFSVAVSDIGAETVTTDSIDVSCNGLCDGSAIVTYVCS